MIVLLKGDVLNATNIDWIITAVFLIFLTVGGLGCKVFIKNTADWTVAGRNMRKFLGLSTGTAEGIGLVTIAAMAEVGFTSGFSYIGMSILNLIIVPLVFGCTGFVINRYRQAKVVTVPEYAQRRYSRGVRVTIGVVLAFAGILNLAIFPIMASQFLTYFLNIESQVSFLGFQVSFVNILMAVLIGMALLFAYAGGMVSVILTDFIQSIIIAVMVFVITILAIKQVGFKEIHETINTNFGQGGYNPFVSNSFGPIFLIWIILQQIIGFPSFAPTMQKIASTDNAKTARQMTMLSWVFGQGRALMMVVCGVAALSIMGAKATNGIDADLYPKVAGAVYLGQLIPPVLFGVVLAGMLAAFISTVDSYLLTWSTVIVNDVISPLIRKPITSRVHLWMLRLCVALIAVALYIFGVVYEPTETLLEFIILTGTMMMGAGVILIGGLYWKRASTAGAYIAVISGCLIPVVHLVLKRVMVDSSKIRAQDFGLGAIVASIMLFIIVAQKSWIVERKCSR